MPKGDSLYLVQNSTENLDTATPKTALNKEPLYYINICYFWKIAPFRVNYDTYEKSLYNMKIMIMSFLFIGKPK